jgi:Helix-turn-helix domain
MLLMDSRLLTTKQAAGYLAYSVNGVHTLMRAGLLPYVRIKDGGLGHPTTRFRISDLDEFILRRTRGGGREYYNPGDPTMPRKLVARLLGITDGTVGVHRHAKGGYLKDLTPESVRRFIELRYHARMMNEVRKAMFDEHRNRLQSYRRRVWKIREIVCPDCAAKVDQIFENRTGRRGHPTRKDCKI